MKYLEKDERPWGRYYVLHDESNYKLKRIEVKSGQRLSYQYHEKRSETWICVQGSGKITLDGESFDFTKNDSISIPLRVKHRIENTGNIDLVFIEVQTGTYFGEDDIKRIEDDYNRI